MLLVSNFGGMVDAQLGAQGSLGSNVQGVEICAWGGSNCNTGSSGGILGGGSDTFRFILSGTWGSSVNINPVGVKYQARFDAYEFEAAGSTPPPPPPPPHAAPEPGALALLGLGVAGLIAIRGRKR